MVNKKDGKNNFLYLGKKSKNLESPKSVILEKIANPHPDSDYLARFSIPEFTSLCPVTNQPDFAKIYIDYVPKKWIVESKSLKLYTQSYRNVGIFHEDAIVTIGKAIKNKLSPKWLRIEGYFYPRGGIPIDIFWQTGRLPKSVVVPEKKIDVYKGR